MPCRTFLLKIKTNIIQSVSDLVIVKEGRLGNIKFVRLFLFITWWFQGRVGRGGVIILEVQFPIRIKFGDNDIEYLVFVIFLLIKKTDGRSFITWGGGGGSVTWVSEVLKSKNVLVKPVAPANFIRRTSGGKSVFVKNCSYYNQLFTGAIFGLNFFQ